MHRSVRDLYRQAAWATGIGALVVCAIALTGLRSVRYKDIIVLIGIVGTAYVAWVWKLAIENLPTLLREVGEESASVKRRAVILATLGGLLGGSAAMFATVPREADLATGATLVLLGGALLGALAWPLLFILAASIGLSRRGGTTERALRAVARGAVEQPDAADERRYV